MQTSTAQTERSSRRPAGLVAWLRVLDASLALIEASVWKLRDVTEETLLYAREDFGRFLDELGLLRERADFERARFARLGSAGLALGKIAASYRLHLTKAAFLSRTRAEKALEKLHAENARRFRQLAESEGGGFLKIGQLLSTRRDLLPEVFIRELEPLQDQAPKLGFEAIKAAVESELGESLDELFAEFESEPRAAASIGQVHRARLHDGRHAAVKVRRPHIRETLILDLELLGAFLEALRSSLPPTDLETIECEIRRALLEEVDFALERERTERFAAALPQTRGARGPAVIHERSSEGVLTTEWIEGVKFTEALEAAGDSEKIRLFELLIESIARQILVDGAFHADPHPGNLFVNEEGELVFIDFGCIGEISPESRREYLRLMQAFLASDRESLGRSLSRLGFETASGNPGTLLFFADSLLGMLRDPERLQNIGSAEDLTRELEALLNAATDDPVVKLPADFILIARVFGTLSGFFMHHKPAFEPARCLLPAISEAMMKAG